MRRQELLHLISRTKQWMGKPLLVFPVIPRILGGDICASSKKIWGASGWANLLEWEIKSPQSQSPYYKLLTVLLNRVKIQISQQCRKLS
jgi:hypothetical protein